MIPAIIGSLCSRLAGTSGMAVIFLLLCAFFTWRTWSDQDPGARAAARQVATRIVAEHPLGTRVMIAIPGRDEDQLYAKELGERLAEGGLIVAAVVSGLPPDVRRALEQASADPAGAPRVIACTRTSADWPVIARAGELFPALMNMQVVVPHSERGSSFLTIDNLLNVANQIVVIAVIAIGMTMVIITGGIDLSVGSLIALSAVICTLLIQDHGGGESAGAATMIGAALVAIVACALIGATSAAMIIIFAVPPFIVTMTMMLIGSGLAYLLSHGQSIYRVPESFMWLGRGTLPGHLPVSLVVMIALYVVAHVLMRGTALGRYIYAVGGNREAARLAGVPVARVLLFVYVLTGALAGLGGVITASQLKSGSPNYGGMYELYVIAAVVVGGTSLSGGEGRVSGTIIGAFIIAVIQNGMNLIGVESYTQKVVLGLVILGAVLFDKLKTLPIVARFVARRHSR